MYFTALSVVLLQCVLFVSTSAEELKVSDVPSACTTICQPIVQLTSICDVDPGKSEDGKGDNDGDKGTSEADETIEAQCICTNKTFNVPSVAALCASCIQQNANGTVDDMDKIMSACSFSSASYAASATAVVAQITVSATKPVVTGTTAVSSTSTGPGQSTQTAAKASLAEKNDMSGVVVLSVTLLGLVISVGMI